MSESSAEASTEEPEEDQVPEIPGMTGPAPTGDDSPDAFVSNDQSAPTPTSERDDEA